MVEPVMEEFNGAAQARTGRAERRFFSDLFAAQQLRHDDLPVSPSGPRRHMSRS